MKEINTKYLIIGAGITGLSMANKLKKDYIIIEKENEVGGYCRTIKKGDYIWDYAGHFFHFKNDTIQKEFIEYVQKENLIEQNKNTKIYYKNKLIDYPFQMNIHELEKNEFIDCLYDLYNKKEKENYDDFLDMLYGKFGISIVDKFLKPYNEKLYACNLKYLDKNAMGRFFPYANIEEIIKNMKESTNNSYNNKFLYPKGGAQSFTDAIYNRLDKKNILLNTEIKKINETEKYVITTKNEKIKFKYLINTTPLNKFIELFDNEDYQKLGKKLSYNQVLVLNLGFEKNTQYKEHWIYVPDKETNYYRIGFYNNILSEDKLSMYVEIGFGKEEKIDPEEQLRKTLENLKKMKIIRENRLLEYSYIVMNPAYVHINNKQSEEIKQTFMNFSKNNIYSIGRYGAWTYCSMEDCILSAINLANKIGGTKNEN